MRVVLVRDDGSTTCVFDGEESSANLALTISELISREAIQLALPKRTAAKIGNIIHRRRIALGLTLQQVSEQANISVGYMSQVEKGANLPTIPILEKLSKGLQFKLSEFFEDLYGQK